MTNNPSKLVTSAVTSGGRVDQPQLAPFVFVEGEFARHQLQVAIVCQAPGLKGELVKMLRCMP